MAEVCVIGVDVGGTNTDAVLLSAGKVLAWSKQTTSPDVTTGILKAVAAALKSVQKGNFQTILVRRGSAVPNMFQPSPVRGLIDLNRLELGKEAA